MSVIDVPGAELERVHDLLQRTKELMDGSSVRSMGPVVDTLGQHELEAAAREFEKRWGDGRYVVAKDLEGVRDAAKAVADAFRETDDQTVAALESDGATS
ncbi:hypothetical protein AB0C06_20460 [Micromonospora inaquosa]|uniref:ESX-1 secretion-associated protein n=1 Tax=Micromonospora inaquosa TaxID=2203716 RepID=A0A3N9WSC5_9ACTN|nr:hypothetical protein [Micromonospora inaquosa]RQX03660.1 hypothetical protein DLJ59_11760 [Micromonospora inaquosa]